MDKVTATGIKIITNNLAGYKDGQLVPAKRVMVYNGIKMIDVKGILANNDLKTVWDTEEYLLEANNNFELESSGGNIESELNIISKCFKFDGSFDWVNYSINPSTIPSNTTNNEKKHTITITQEKSGLQVKSTCTQAADSYLNTVYSEPVVTHVEAEVADAWGSDVMLSVSYTQKVTHYYGSGNNIEETINGTINPTITSGSAKVSNVTRNGKYIEVPSAGTYTYSSPRTVYTVTGYSFTVNGKTKNVSGVSINVKQEANFVETQTYSNYYLNLTTNVSSLHPSANPGVYIYVECHRDRKDVYTSGDTSSPVQENINANLSTSYGNLGSSVVLGGKSTTFIPNANNSDEERTITINATCAVNGAIKDTLTLVQGAAEYSFNIEYISPNSLSVPASGGTVEIAVSSTKNNVVTSKPTVTTGVTYASVQDSMFDDINGDRYVYTIKVNSHMNSSGRTFNVVFTQPGTGDTLSVPISQAKYQSSSGGSSTGTATIDEAYFIDPEYSAVDTSVTFEGDSTISDVVIKIQSTNTASGNVYGSHYIGNVTPYAVEQCTIENSNMSPNVYVVVYSGTKILASRKVEAI